MSGLMQSKTVQCVSPAGLHRMAYVEWGDPSLNRVVLCVHGLTRTGRDFDVLAGRLSQHYRVVCPDIVGRGKSEWLRDPNGYVFPQYVADIVTLIARLNVEQIDYVGTSMGGLIGMLLGAMPDTPIRKMVINDVGPHIEPMSLMRLREYLVTPGQLPRRFATAQEGVDYIAAQSSGFGPLTVEQWRALNAPMLRRVEDGFAIRADPGIAQAFHTANMATAVAGELALWQAFDALHCPVLVTRGAQSDLLSSQTLTEMARRGRAVETIEFDGVGHAPTFIDPAQSKVVERFLLG